jgi:hypothetical protein
MLSAAPANFESSAQLPLKLAYPKSRLIADSLLQDLLRDAGEDIRLDGDLIGLLTQRFRVHTRSAPISTAGQLLYDRERPVVLVSEFDAVPRQRYTLAHELAHLLVIRAGSTCRSAHGAARSRHKTERLVSEWQVEQLGAAILMPRDRFIDEVERGHACGIRGLELVKRLKATFTASTTATSRRLASLCRAYLAISTSRRSVPGKPPRNRIDWSVTLNSAVGYIPRHKSVSDCGPISEAANSRQLRHGWIVVMTKDRCELVVHAEALPNQRQGALLIADLIPSCGTPRGGQVAAPLFCEP